MSISDGEEKFTRLTPVDTIFEKNDELLKIWSSQLKYLTGFFSKAETGAVKLFGVAIYSLAE